MLSDYFVIASGKTATQVKALARRLREKVRTSRKTHVEGEDLGLWVLMDYGDVIVHIFREPERSFYGLERLWGDAPRLEVPLDAEERSDADHEAPSDAHGMYPH